MTGRELIQERVKLNEGAAAEPKKKLGIRLGPAGSTAKPATVVAPKPASVPLSGTAPKPAAKGFSINLGPKSPDGASKPKATSLSIKPRPKVRIK